MQKITELAETRYKTVREKDAAGKRIPKQVAYTAYRKVNVISGGKRFAHAFVDGIVYYVIYYFVEYTWLVLSQKTNNALQTFFIGFYISVVFMFLVPIYYIVFEHFLQRTPGKFLTKSLVIDEYGNKPELGVNVLRNIIRLVPFESISCLFNERGWHDRWSGTYVVSEDEYTRLKELLAKQEDAGLPVETIKPVSSKKLRAVFLYVVLPLSFILYVGIIVKSLTGAKDAITNLNEPQRGPRVSETAELDEISEMYSNGQIDEAQAKLLAFTKHHTDYSSAWTILGHTYADQKKYEKAIEAYKTGIRVNKNDYAPHNGLGLVYSYQEDYKNAMKELKLADSLDPFNGSVLGNIANVYHDLEDLKSALTYGESSVKYDSANAVLNGNLSIYYYNDKQFDNSNRLFIKAAKLGYDDIQELADVIYPLDAGEGYITLAGIVTHGFTDVPLRNAKLTVVNKDSLIIRRTYTDEDGNYTIIFPAGIADNYLVKVSYPKYAAKSFLVNTENIPASRSKTMSTKVVAELALSEKLDGVDYSYLSKPMNRFYYNTAKNNFDYDQALYEETVKQVAKLKEMEKKAVLPRKRK